MRSELIYWVVLIPGSGISGIAAHWILPMYPPALVGVLAGFLFGVLWRFIWNTA